MSKDNTNRKKKFTILTLHKLFRVKQIKISAKMFYDGIFNLADMRRTIHAIGIKL